METVFTCPLGNTCEEIRDNKIHKCHWLCELQGTNPQTGVPEVKKGCSLSFLPLLLIENTGANRGAQSATEDMRNKFGQVIQAFAQMVVKNQKQIGGRDGLDK